MPTRNTDEEEPMAPETVALPARTPWTKKDMVDPARDTA